MLHFHKAKKSSKVKLLGVQSDGSKIIPIGTILTCIRDDESLSYIQAITENENIVLLGENEYELYNEEIVFNHLYYRIHDMSIISDLVKWMLSIGRTTKYNYEDVNINYNYMFVEYCTKGFHFGYSEDTTMFKPLDELYKSGLPRMEEKTIDYKIGDRVIVGEANVTCPGWKGSIGIVVEDRRPSGYYYVQGVNNRHCLYTKIKGLAPKESSPQVDFESSKNIKPKFKKTNKVLFQQGGFYYCEPTSQENCIGFPTNNCIIEYIIEEFIYKQGHFWYKLVDYGNWVTEGGLQKINTTTKEQPIPDVYNPTTKPTPKFKYLDLVRVDIHDGEFIVISSEYRYDTHFYVVESTGVEGRLNGMSEDRISFAPVLMPESKFKIGDWVNYGEQLFCVNSIEYSKESEEYILYCTVCLSDGRSDDGYNYICVESSLSLHTRWAREGSFSEDEKALKQYLGLLPRDLIQKENITLMDTRVIPTKPLKQELVSQESVFYF